MTRSAADELIVEMLDYRARRAVVALGAICLGYQPPVDTRGDSDAIDNCRDDPDFF